MQRIPILLCLFFSLTANMNCLQAQRDPDYRYDKDFLPPSFYQDRRNALRDLMPDSSIAIVFNAPVRNRSNDVDYPYHASPDFYYLTGFREPNSLVLIMKNIFQINGQLTNEVLFVPTQNPEYEKWNGRRAGTQIAAEISGIKTCYSSGEFLSRTPDFTEFAKVLYTSFPKGIVNDRKDTSDLYDLLEQFKLKSAFPAANGDDYKLGKMLRQLREVKQPGEIELLRKAVLITCAGFREMIKATESGMHEFEVQAIGEYIFKSRGAEHTGYPSICGAGENSCILHYTSNRRPLQSGHLLLLDMGAEYRGYTADITRTLPVSGSFTHAQRDIYQLVLDARAAAFSAIEAGTSFQAPHQAARAVVLKGLAELGIAVDAKDAERYYPHHTSHHLGLDVHDPLSSGKLQEGAVFTIEPGIYIPPGSPCDPKWWSIGIRIEDDILVLKSGYENLSAELPVEIDQIEALMQEDGIFNK